MTNSNWKVRATGAIALALFLICCAAPLSAQVDVTLNYRITNIGRGPSLSFSSTEGGIPTMEPTGNELVQSWQLVPEGGPDLYRMSSSLLIYDGLWLSTVPNEGYLAMAPEAPYDGKQLWKIRLAGSPGVFVITNVALGDNVYLNVPDDGPALAGMFAPSTVMDTERWLLEGIGSNNLSTSQGQHRIARATVFSDGFLDTARSHHPLTGNAIPVSHPEPGVYEVRFNGLLQDYRSITHLGSYQVSAQGASSNYCNIGVIGYDTVYAVVHCFDSAGAKADTPFTLWWIPAENGEEVSFAAPLLLVVPPLNTGYTTVQDPYGSQGIQTTFSGPGRTSIQFPFPISASDGAVMVTAAPASSAGASAPPERDLSCVTDPVSQGDLTVAVFCVDPSGTEVETPYFLMVNPGQDVAASVPRPTELAYTRVTDPSADSSVGAANVTNNPGGGSVSIARRGTGFHEVVFANLDPLMRGGHTAMVTSLSSSARCSLGEVGRIGTNAAAQVFCFGLDGVARDTKFSLLMLPHPSLNLVQNGSFEQPALRENSVAVTSNFPDWVASTGGFETSRGSTPAFDGSQFLKLDATLYDNSAIYQDIPTEPGRTYRLSFATRNEPGSASISIQASWNGLTVVTTGTMNDAWALVEVDVVADTETSRLSLSANGPEDHLGDFLDDVRLVRISCPSGSIALGSSVDGALETSDCGAADQDDTFADNYSLTLPSSETVVITLTSNAFDAYLNVTDGTAGTVHFDDDGAGGSNSRLTLALPAGAHNIEVTSYLHAEVGPYTLTVATADIPVINSLDPASVPVGGPSFTLTVNGMNFCGDSMIRWDGSPLTTTFVSPAQLTALVESTRITSGGTAFVTVTNPAETPGCTVGDSNQVSIRIKLADPTITSISPASVPAGNPAFQLTVNGASFCSSSVVRYHGSGPIPLVLETTFVSPARLVALVPDDQLVMPRTIGIQVTNGAGCPVGSPDPNTNSSNLVALIVRTGTAPSTTSLSTSASASLFGEQVALTATVAPASSGLVTFYDGTTILGTGPVVAGRAALNTILLATGTRSLRAYYGGDATFAPSTSTMIMQTVTALPGTGFAPALEFTVEAFPTGLAVGDFNEDGKTDLATANYSGGSVSVLLGVGDGNFRTAVNYSVGASPRSLAVGDFNGDGNTDLVVATLNGITFNLLLGAGDGTFRPGLDIAVGEFPGSVAVGDFNGDGNADLAVTIGYDSVNVLLGTGTGAFQTGTTFPAGNGAGAVTVNDFNGDKKADLVVANSQANTVSVLLGNGDGTFRSAVDYPAGSGPESLAAGDFNGDGKADLAVANSQSANVSVLLGAGTGTFQAAVDYPVGGSPGSVTVADFNGDGKVDLAVENVRGADPNVTGFVTVLPGTGDGRFPATVHYPAGGSPGSVTVADFNGDGRADLAVGNALSQDGPDTVSVLLASAPAATPVIRSTNPVESAFQGKAGFGSNMYVEIHGTNLAQTTRTWEGSDFQGPIAPTSLDGVSVTVNGKPAFIYFISPKQINVNTPEDTAVGEVAIQVTTPEGASNIVYAERTRLSPTLHSDFRFAASGKKYVVALTPDFLSYIGPPGLIEGVSFVTVRPGDSIAIYVLGAGPTVPATSAGVATAQNSVLDLPYEVRIGGVPATVSFAGAVAGAIGLYQFNIFIPNVAAGDHSIELTVDGVPNNQNLFIRIED